MSRLPIDFAARGWRHALAQSRWPQRSVAAAGLVVCALLAWFAHARWQAYNDGQQQLVQLQHSLARQHERQLPPRRVQMAPERANAVNQAISQLNLPWQDVLDAMELATPGSVALLSMEPDALRRKLKCVAEARDGETMLAYIEQLKKSEFFDSVVLLRHELVEKDPGHPIRFQFEAHWPMARP